MSRNNSSPDNTKSPPRAAQKHADLPPAKDASSQPREVEPEDSADGLVHGSVREQGVAKPPLGN